VNRSIPPAVEVKSLGNEGLHFVFLAAESPGERISMAQPSTRTTMRGLLARQSSLATECWWRWYEYEAASKKDKPALEKEIKALAGEIDKLETTIFNHRQATQCWGADRPVKSRNLPIHLVVLTRISITKMNAPTP